MTIKVKVRLRLWGGRALRDLLMFRRHRVAESLGLRLPAAVCADDRPWHAVVMSRLGRNPSAKRVPLATLFRWTEQAAAVGEVPLCVAGTAAYDWSCRACELLGVAPVRLAVAGNSPEMNAAAGAISMIALPDASAVRDRLAVELADRLDVVSVRRGGTIERLVRQRLMQQPDASVRILVEPSSPDAPTAEQLIACGAVGHLWQFADEDADEPSGDGSAGKPEPEDIAAARSLLKHPDRWLIHWTRACQGEWPGQSEAQFRDELLLSSPHPQEVSPLETLQRILRQRMLLGTSRTTHGTAAVVCLSAIPLVELAARRTFRPHLGRWDAEPYGVAVDRSEANRLGARPVIYVDADEDGIGDEEHAWLRHPRGKTYDWTSEQEWRVRGTLDLSRFAPGNVVAFVAFEQEAARLRRRPLPATLPRLPVVSLEMLPP